MVLTNAVNPFNVLNRDANQTILGRIIRVTDEVVRYRMWMEQQFGGMHTPPVMSPSLQFSKVVGGRAPRSLSSTGSTSSVDSGASSEVR